MYIRDPTASTKACLPSVVFLAALLFLAAPFVYQQKEDCYEHGSVCAAGRVYIAVPQVFSNTEGHIVLFYHRKTFMNAAQRSSCFVLSEVKDQ